MFTLSTSLPSLLLLLLLALSRSPLSTAQLFPPVNLTLLSVSGDGDCVNVGSVALNCSFPFTLNLTVVSLPIPVPAYALDVILDRLSYALQPNLFTATFTPSLISIRVASFRFVLPALTVFGLSLTWTTTVNATTRVTQSWGPTPAFSIQPWSFPRVDSITGCQPSETALLTQSCYPEQDVLTLTGSGFSQIVSATLDISGANVTALSRTIYPGYTAGVKVVNDSSLTIGLSNALGFLLYAEHYSGDLLQMTLSDVSSFWQTPPFFITMAVLPPPVITRFTVYGIAPTFNGSVTTYSGCIPGESQLSIEGRYLFGVSVTVGGFECSTDEDYNYAFLTELLCTLDDGDQLTPNLAYDVVIATDEGRAVIPQAIAFTSQPSLSHVLPCWDDGGFYPYFGFPVPRCMIGDTLTVVGRRLLRGGLEVSRVSFETFYAPPSPYINCSNPQIISDTELTCVMLPNSDPDYIMRTAKLVSQWGGSYTTNAFFTYPYDFLDAPRILSIEGCGMMATNPQALFLTSCQPGDSLLLSGYNLNVLGGIAIQSIRHESTNYSVFACAQVQVWNASTVSCTLPSLTEFPALLNFSQYNVTLSRATYQPLGSAAEFTSNYFAVTFGDASVPPTPDTSQGSSGGGGDTVAVVVSVVVLVVAIAVSVGIKWWMCRRKGRGETEVDTEGHNSSDFPSRRSFTVIELTDK